MIPYPSNWTDPYFIPERYLCRECGGDMRDCACSEEIENRSEEDA